MHQSAIKFVLLAIASLSAALSLPEDAPQGPAIAFQYDNGTWVWDYQTPHALAGSQVSSKAEPTQLPIRIPVDRATCNGFTMNLADVAAAEKGLADTFGKGPFTWGGRAITYTSGTVTAFGCNYGNGQQSYSATFMDDMGNVDSKCGTNGAGWYGHNEWKATYGRTLLGQGFC